MCTTFSSKKENVTFGHVHVTCFDKIYENSMSVSEIFEKKKARTVTLKVRMNRGERVSFRDGTVNHNEDLGNRRKKPQIFQSTNDEVRNDRFSQKPEYFSIAFSKNGNSIEGNKTSCLIDYRKDTQIFMDNDGDDDTDVNSISILKRRESNKPIVEPLWVLLNSLPNCYSASNLTRGEWLRLGRCAYRVSEVWDGRSSRMFSFLKYDALSGLGVCRFVKSGNEDAICRFCLEGSEDEESKKNSIRHGKRNPLLSVCKCNGSSAWIHPHCLNKWLMDKFRSSFLMPRHAITESITAYSLTRRMLFCEICQTYLPEAVEFQDYRTRKPTCAILYMLPRPASPYLILESPNGYQILIVFGDNTNKDLWNMGGKLTVGRSQSSELRLTSSCISRKHATISFSKGVFSITDLGSRFGTFVTCKGSFVLAQGVQATLITGKKVFTVSLEKPSRFSRLFGACLVTVPHRDDEVDGSDNNHIAETDSDFVGAKSLSMNKCNSSKMKESGENNASTRDHCETSVDEGE